MKQRTHKICMINDGPSHGSIIPNGSVVQPYLNVRVSTLNEDSGLPVWLMMRDR
ncbi:MAG: hypothetical protein ACI32N_09185 [Bulleidia sp.]